MKTIKATFNPKKENITPLFYSILQASEHLYHTCNATENDTIEYEININIKRGEQHGKSPSK